MSENQADNRIDAWALIRHYCALGVKMGDPSTILRDAALLNGALDHAQAMSIAGEKAAQAEAKAAALKAETLAKGKK